MGAHGEIHFTIIHEAPTSLDVFDSTGRRIRTLFQKTFDPGRHSVVWDGMDDGGHRLPSGVYHCRVVSGTASRSVTLVQVR
jgi:flagellar hook assembly protein FlgD